MMPEYTITVREKAGHETKLTYSSYASAQGSFGILIAKDFSGTVADDVGNQAFFESDVILSVVMSPVGEPGIVSEQVVDLLKKRMK